MDVQARRVLDLLEREGALTARALARALGVPRSHVRSLRRTLRALVRDQRIARVDRGRYGLVGDGRVIEGRFSRDPRGHGHVGSVLVPRSEARDLADGDRIRIRVRQTPRGSRGEVVEVIRRTRPHRAGIVREVHDGVRVVPYRDRRYWEVTLPPADARGLREGTVVLVETLAVTPGPGPGRLLRVLGDAGDRDVDVHAVAAANDIPVDFPEEVLEEARDRAAVGVPEEEVARRTDLRGERIVTIDGEDARDFDDAVGVTPLPAGRFRLRVSIADVSFYVPSGSALDREAFERGNSVYFPDRAIPMLPESLSADLCSLRPGEDRLAVTADLVLDGEGRPLESSFYPSVIRSAERLTYTEVSRMLEGPVPTWIEPLERLTRTLIRRREREGSIDFDLPEPEIRLDEQGEVVSVGARTRTLAHRMIEEFMLAANRAVAERLVEGRRRTVFRIHEPPDPEQVELLAETFGELGIPLRDSSSGSIAGALRALEDRPQKRALHFLMLRAMKQARYAVENPGHYALNFQRYVHFTSPIRRYADLVVHRTLKALLAGEPAPPFDAGAIAERTTERERAAIEAERTMIDIYRAEFMERHIGDEFEGVISGVARPGLFVTLEPVFVDGLVPVSSLPDYFDVDDRGLALVGRRSGERFALGDRVRVRVEAVDPLRCAVTLGLADRPHPTRRRRMRGRRW